MTLFRPRFMSDQPARARLRAITALVCAPLAVAGTFAFDAATAQPRNDTPAQPRSSTTTQRDAAPRTTPAPDEIVVTADFREAVLAELPTSVSVLDRETLATTTVQHFEETIRQVPNLNLSGEGSRARYFQLRGIGELEQYEGSPNPSVGFIVDDIDFSGLGSIGTLFDVERVEVLRGPQGTRYGSNALGGLIYMRSTAPSAAAESSFEATTGNDGTLALGAAHGGPVGDAWRYRASIHHYGSNGFRDNVFLNRDDTYDRDELTARGKLEWDAGGDTTVALSALYVDVDNGYDAWTVENGFTTYSDKPGRDAQRSAAASVRVDASLERVDLVSITGFADTDAVFSFDADWGNDAYWAPYVYDYFQSFDRGRKTLQQELRVLSKPGAFGGRGEWLAGVYALDLDESNDEYLAAVDGVFCDPQCAFEDFAWSDFTATNVALFGQVSFDLSERLALTTGLRYERRDADYVDSSGNRFAPKDDMRGGEVALNWLFDANRSAYVKLARGYKAGGFNASLGGQDFSTIDNLSPERIEFGPETLTSLEAGYRAAAADGRWSTEIAVFAARRGDQQVKVPRQLDLGDPASFLFITANAERGTHRGIEATVDWRPAERWSLHAAVGTLDAEIDRFSLFPDIEGRAPAHAPRYTYSVGGLYRGSAGWWARADLSGMDDFYFDYGHDAAASGYAVLDARVGRQWNQLGVSLWARNLLDKEYAVRGFFFGNVPPDFPEQRFIRLGDPRHYGITLTYSLQEARR